MMSGLVSDVSRSHDQPNNNLFLNVFLKIFEIVGLWSYLGSSKTQTDILSLVLTPH